ncbi:MAG: hypothetical protein K6E97_07440 [Treponema sp.]|nr:hypothetical protein [Treponema sp.]
MSKKSTTCFSKSGPKTEYETEEEANENIKYILEKQGKEFYPYKCTHCHKWHISPIESKINIIKDGCFCTDDKGCVKTLYATKEDAEKQKKKSAEKGITLYVYKCPDSTGWHLTHHSPKSYD